MNTKQPTRATEVATLTGLIAGAKKRFATVGQLTFGGATFTLTALVDRLQGLLDQLAGVDAARAAFQAKLKDLRTQAPATRTIARAFKAFVRALFGNQPEVLVDFGLAPIKAPAPRTVEQKQLAADRNRATRKARGTKGPKAKLAITGNVANATAPATPAPAEGPPVPATATAANPPRP